LIIKKINSSPPFLSLVTSLVRVHLAVFRTFFIIQNIFDTMKYTYFKGTLCVLLLLCLGAGAHAQVRGLVRTADTQEVLPGVLVAVKGKTLNAITNEAGNFDIDAKAGDRLIISYVGFRTEELTVGTQNSIEVFLESSAALDEVVVTALGIEKSKKALGYAVSEVEGAALTQARETNVLNSLSGRIAGVQVVANPSGIGSSARVSIRGERSLNINNNQPLFVVDGVPINNQYFGSSGGPSGRNQEVDYGNGAGFINPDDIESLTVLKGPSAAALYGSRANNGVIVIKTKTGARSRGIGVSVNSTTSFENALRLPDYQNKYGQGLNGEFEFRDGNGGGLRDGVDEAWGPEMTGQLLSQYDGPTANGFRGGDVGNLFSPIAPVNLSAQLDRRGAITPTAFNAYPDNIRNFFETGTTFTNNVALTGGNDAGAFRLSYTNLDQKGFVPNTDLRRNTVAFTGSYNLSKRLRANINLNYINNASNNRPNLSYGTENIMYLFNCWLPRNIDLEPMRDYWQAGREGLNQYNFNYNYHDNPYFNLFENTNGQDINRVFGNMSVNIKLAENLNLMLRSGTDFSDEFRDRRRAYSTQRYLLGSYREEKIRFQERNNDFLLSWNKPVNEKWDLSLSLGGNQMQQKRNSSDAWAPELAVPGVYSLNNSRVAVQTSTFRSERRINSLYATGQIGFNRYLYLDLSARNDWSSTLPTDSRSYLYYSANASAVISDMLNLSASSPLSFAKVRLGFAQVGNDTDPYQLQAVYSAQTAALGNPTFAEAAQIPNSGLKPEISTSLEAGIDVRFLRNRIGLDLTVYNTDSRNQILPVPLSTATGYSARLINAGLINNRGIEAMLHLVPVRTRNFSWEVDYNAARNVSEVKELFTDPISGQEITNYVIASRYVTVEARVGDQMGDMYGIGYERVSSDPNSKYYDPTGQYVGQIVYNNAGKPIATANRIKLGNYNPDWLMGINNNMTYKGINFGFLFDFRLGGEMYSHTQTVGREGGIISETLEGRANGYDLSLEGNGVVGEGAVPQYDGTRLVGFQANNVKLPAREWHTTITLGRRLVEGMVYDASFTKLREVRLGYTLPKKWLSGARIQNLNVTLVGRNLLLWTKVPHVDPETSSTSGGTVIPGVESVALPSTRSFGINLGLNF
jgi:TonB-linked SusC/RagA family outer membrane protein